MMTEMDDTYIEEAYTYKPQKRRVWARVAAMAACVAVVIGAGWGVCCSLEKEPEVTYPTVVEYDAEEGDYIAACYASPGAPLTFAQIADEADVIICADVTDVTLVEGGKDWQYSYATVKVREVLKGDVTVGGSYVVKDSDTVCDDVRYFSCGPREPGPLMEKRNRVVLFLKGNGETAGSFDDPFEINTATSGKFYLDADGMYRNAVTYVRFVGEHSLYLDPDLADLEPKTLDEIKRLIHEKGLLYPHRNERVTLLDDSNLPDKIYGIPGLTNASSLVVCADVSMTRTIVEEDGKRAFLATVTVRECLKGEHAAGDTLTIVDNGVRYDDGSSATYCGGPLMREGNRVLLFLNDSDEWFGAYEITTGVSGKFYLTRAGGYVNSMCYAAEYDYFDDSWEQRSRINFTSLGSLEKYKQTVRPLL